MTKGAVIFAEDDPMNRELLRVLLEHGGYTPVPVGNGEDCLRALSGISPRALLLDVNMPGMNGLEVLRTIRGSQHWSEIPVVIVTSRPDADVIQSARQFPKVYVIAKPLRAEDFIPRLERCLVLARMNPNPTRIA